MTDLEVVTDGLLFPEGPVAMPDGSVLVVEIARGTLTRVQPGGAKDIVANLGGGPNGAAIGPDGACWICNNGGCEWIDNDGLLFPGDASADYSGGRIERVDLESGDVDVVYTTCHGNALKGPNDIVFDATGGFWFSDTGKRYGRTVDRSGVLYARADGSHIEERLFPFESTNGVGLSPDDGMLYFSETLTGRIWQYALAGSGELSQPLMPFNPEDMLYGAPGLQGFDSMALEKNGNICQATLFSGGISVISPRGELVEFVEMPDPLVTNICFGGEDLRTAYITLSGTGRLVRMRWPRPGLPLHFLNR